jgi:hypothetical protein
MTRIDKDKQKSVEVHSLKKELSQTKTRLIQISEFLISCLKFKYNYHESSLRISQDFITRRQNSVNVGSDAQQFRMHLSVVENYSSALEICPKIQKILKENDFVDVAVLEKKFLALRVMFNLVDKYIFSETDYEILTNWSSLKINDFNINRGVSISEKLNLFKDEENLSKLTEIIQLLQKPLQALDLVDDEYFHQENLKERIASLKKLSIETLEGLANSFDCDFTQFANPNSKFQLNSAKLLSKFGLILSKVFKHRASILKEDHENYSSCGQIRFIPKNEITQEGYVAQYYFNNFVTETGLANVTNPQELYNLFIKTIAEASNANDVNLDIWVELFQHIGYPIKLEPLKEFINQLKLEDFTYEIRDDTIDQLFDLAKVSVVGNYNTVSK